MSTDTMNPATAVTWGPFIQAAYDQYTSDPAQPNPAAIKNMPAGYTLVRTIQMTAHALNTYLHVLSSATVPLNPACS